jgi:hypothetical protein
LVAFQLHKGAGARRRGRRAAAAENFFTGIRFELKSALNYNEGLVKWQKTAHDVTRDCVERGFTA